MELNRVKEWTPEHIEYFELETARLVSAGFSSDRAEEIAFVSVEIIRSGGKSPRSVQVLENGKIFYSDMRILPGNWVFPDPFSAEMRSFAEGARQVLGHLYDARMAERLAKVATLKAFFWEACRA